MISEAMGYSVEELASIPQEANMGLSCGNTIQIANLREGETVVDLGSGGGLDAFLASKRVGPKGKVIGVDMTEEMIELAQENARRGGYKNVKFVLSEISEMAVDGAVQKNSVDCCISNCVINLIADKPAAFKAIYEILKPGGRLVASDIALKKDLPDNIRSDVAAYTGCIAGAILIEDYKKMLEEAGFAAVEILDASKDLNVYKNAESSCCGPPNAGASSCCGPASAKVEAVGCGDCGPDGCGACDAPKQASASSCCGGSSKASSGCCGGSAEVKAPARQKVSTDDYDVNEFAASVKVFAVKAV